jgi:hypothetical protein
MRTPFAVVIALTLAAPARAQQPLQMSFDGGRVSINASAVPVRTILSEWARLGGTQVVNAEKISGPAVTIQLVDVPEAQALEILLRNVAGYMAAPRRAANGASFYDRILVMPTSTAPVAASATGRGNTPAGANAGTQRFVGRPPNPADLQEAPEEIAEDVDPGVNQPAFSFPQPGPGQFPQPGPGLPGQGIFQPMAPGTPTPFGTPVPSPFGQPPTLNLDPNAAAGGSGVVINPAPQAPGMPGFPTATPGMSPAFGTTTTVPGQVQPVQPVQPGVRPPGDR